MRQIRQNQQLVLKGGRLQAPNALLTPEQDDLLKRMTEVSEKVTTSLKTFSHTFELTAEEMKKFVASYNGKQYRWGDNDSQGLMQVIPGTWEINDDPVDTLPDGSPKPRMK